jgi:pyrimidine-nucleoside phosphorylase
MNVYELIKKKRDGNKLTSGEIQYLISNFVKGDIPDYQFSAFLMSVYFQGMSIDEIWALTKAMIESGKTLDLSSISGPKIDKHSTGGVGDKISIILAPLVAACGVVVPMISGRGLGHTGGTLDKLESIPGFRTDLSTSEFIKNLSRIGVAIIGQSDEIVPVDKKIYALRDVTATVDSIPLIAASIMSKKMTAGISGLVLDVKTGSGAFMPRLAQARKLAQLMVAIGQTMGRKVTAFITDMSQPLGKAVGNSLEIAEVIDCLKGDGPDDVMELTYAFGAEMLTMAKRSKYAGEAKNRLKAAIADGSALEKFRSMVKLQSGDERVVDDPSILPKAPFVMEVKAEQSGYISKMATTKIGLLLNELGGGRKKLDDAIDPAVGFVFEKKTADRVKRGEVLVRVFAGDGRAGNQSALELGPTITITPARPKIRQLILEKLG